MKHDQDITGPNTITAGEYKQIVAPVYTDDTDTTPETDLGDGLVEWHLKGVKGIDLISKSTDDESITVYGSTSNYIVIEIFEEDTIGLTSGDYYHLAEFTVGGVKLGLFDGICTIDNRVGGD